MTATEPAANPRRHDLDALRGFAMLLGIALHAALSFAPSPWMVQDSRQSGGFWLFFSAVHGFRMPLFFLLSGFFTAMLWRRRGLGALLKQRFKRVFLPCMLGLVTLVPLTSWISAMAIESGQARARNAAANKAPEDLWSAAARGDLEAVNRFLAEGTDVNAKDPKLGGTALSHAAMAGQVEVVQRLLEVGADVNARNADGGTALHGAAFFGRADAAALLLKHGADTTLRNQSGSTPGEAMQTGWKLTQFIAGALGVQLERQTWQDGRERIAQMLREKSGADIPRDAKSQRRALLAMLMYVPVFHHLWFLWFLCWLVAAFAVYAKIAGWLKWRGPPRWLVVSPLRYLWLVPLTMIPQAFMGLMGPNFGPDTSAGLLPMPQVLLYYAIFFGFGALYYDSNDSAGRAGRRWWFTLPVALLFVLPVGLDFTFSVTGVPEMLLPRELHRPVGIALQVFYAWLMTFGMMGLFRRLLTRERRAIRYLSDSSYWLYLAHLPLVIAAQWLVRDWPFGAFIKFTGICIAASLLLLASYQLFVRHTWVGRLLNGPRARHKETAETPPAAV